MRSIERQMLGAFTSLAALAVTAQESGESLPEAGATPLDLTTAMNDVGIAGVTFADATIGQGSDGTWGYVLDMGVTDSGEAVEVPVRVELAHLETTGGFEGVLWFRSGPGHLGCSVDGSSVTTQNASLAYAVSGSDVRLEARTAVLCGEDSDGRASDGLLDPTSVASPDNPDGWDGNFSIFTANFDATTLEGSYAYSWQAGAGDRNARSLNVQAGADDSGTAFFGYSAQLQDEDPPLLGMICNWLYGGGIQTALQRQTFQLGSAGTYDVVTSNVSYAPVDDCSYTSGGTFKIDEDGDGDLSDEVVLDRTSDLADTDLNDDATADDADGNGVLDVVEAAGFEQPAPPSISVQMPY